MERVENPRITTPIRWGRIIVGGILLESLLLVLAVPLLAFVANPFSGTAAATADFTAFYASVGVACFVAGLLGGLWVGRPLVKTKALHGALAGIVATLIYLALCSVPPNSIGLVVTSYGLAVFIAINILRIAGAAVGATVAPRR